MSTTCLEPTATSVPLIPRVASSNAGPRVYVERLAARIVRAIRMRRAARILQEMPDHLLSDIGIARGDIHDAIHNGRPWRDDMPERM